MNELKCIVAKLKIVDLLNYWFLWQRPFFPWRRRTVCLYLLDIMARQNAVCTLFGVMQVGRQFPHAAQL